MNLFQNGRPFRQAIRREYRRDSGSVPVVAIQMQKAFEPTAFPLIVGKMDTGASRTVLTFETARRLGMDDRVLSRDEEREKKSLHCANGVEIPYAEEQILVRISESNRTPPIVFYLDCAFSSAVKYDLFGMDFVETLCLVVDREAVHFCKG